jgi:hypothetical protein
LTPTKTWLLNMPTNRRHTVVASLRDCKRTVPFKPFQIRMTTGETFKVLHQDYFYVSPKGSLVIFVDANDCPHHLNAGMIENVSLSKGGKRR